MRVFLNVNSVLASNTYILSSDTEDTFYIIDPGDVLPIFDWIKLNKKRLAGIILTHSHYDHIYGVNELLNVYPESKLFLVDNMVAGLLSEKLNTSLYHEKPYIIQEIHIKKIVFINELNYYFLWCNTFFSIISTPGHTPDSISIKVNKFLFCGDALIPGMKTYKVKSSNLKDINLSIVRICSTLPLNTILFPGHGKFCILGELGSIKEFIKNEVSNGFCEIF